MASKERGGLSKREFAAQGGKVSSSKSSSSSSSSFKAPKAPKLGSFKFDSSKLLPQYQTEAASLYNPQIQQVKGLQDLTKAQSEDARVRTKDQFAQLLKREQENINRRGAFFSGGAIDQENRIGAQEGGALRDIGFQEQSANLQYQGTLSEIAQAQKDYVSSKVEGAYSSAYKTFQDKIANSINSYQLELGQYNQDRQFEQSKLESDRTYELQRQAAARAGGSGSGTSKVDTLLARASQMGSGGREWAESVASQYGVDPGQIRQLTAKDGWEAAYGGGATTDQKAIDVQTNAANQAYKAVSAVGRLSQMGGLNAAVGPISSKIPTLRGQTADFEAQIDQVKSLLVLPELAQLKGLGAMSDREFATLSNAATTLSTKQSEQGFRNEMDRIQGALSNTLNKAAQMGVFQPSYMNVYDINTGQPGQIPDYEFNPKKYSPR